MKGQIVRGGVIKDENVPNYIEGALRLIRDLESLHELIKSEFPSID